MKSFTASDVNAAAVAIARRGDGWGSDRPKVYLSDLADELGETVPGMTMDLLRWHRDGLVVLQRADLAGAMDPAKLRASEIETPIARYHFIVPSPDARAREEHGFRARAGAFTRTLPRGRIGAKRNPAVTVSEDAVEMYKTFHRNDPKWVGQFDPSFVIPTRVRQLGEARFVLYRSDKVDPETLKKPRKPVDYIHDHEGGVSAYDTRGRLDTEVPTFITDTTALVLLGACLGFGWSDDDVEAEAEVTAPLPELYTIPAGTALLVVEDKRHVAAIIWGGALGVEGRGIVG